MLGAKAASADKSGKTEALWDIMDRMSKPGRAVVPTSDPHEKELLAVKYKVFLEQCQSQQEYRRDVDDVVEKWGNSSSQEPLGTVKPKAEQGEKGKQPGGMNTRLPGSV